MRTGTSEEPTCFRKRSIFLVHELDAMHASPERGTDSVVATVISISRGIRSAFWIALIRFSWLTGLGRKSLAPLLMASTTCNGEDAPESIMIGRPLYKCRISPLI